MHDIENIYAELKAKIHAQRLKDISVDIIDKYKRKDRAGLDFYAGLLNLNTPEISTGRLFSRIIQNYHPDKTMKILSDIERSYQNNKIDELLNYKNMFIFKDPGRGETAVDLDMHDEYSFSADDFGYDEESIAEEEFAEECEGEETWEGPVVEHEYGFIEAINRLIFGNLDLTLNANDLLAMEGELDLSDYEIYDLKGIEYCRNINALNLSGNRLRRIEALSGLTQLESLFLSENEIGSIAGLSELTNLKELDISFNEVEDISVLNKLENLLYVNLIGNPIKDKKIIKSLTEKGVMVIC